MLGFSIGTGQFTMKKAIKIVLAIFLLKKIKVYFILKLG